jgi:hypothetical protein
LAYVLPSEVDLSPILVRPVREQLEHDRVIRVLQVKYKRKYEVAINPGNEQTMPVGSGPSAWYPDLVLQTSDRGHKLAGVVEVETAESVNNLEAMSQWAAFARLRVPFHLYLPTSSIDSARRFCADFGIPIAELWAYQLVGDQLRFTLVQRAQADGKSATVAPHEAPAEPKPKAASSRPADNRRTTRPVARRAPERSRAARAAGAAAARPARRPAVAASRRPASASKAAPRRAAPAKATVRGKTKTARRPARPQKRR